VAPTAPCSIEYESSSIDAESFHKQVGVVRAISKSGLLYLSCELECAIITPDGDLRLSVRIPRAQNQLTRLYFSEFFMIWSGRRDSNPRPSAPKTEALPDCATPRQYA